MGERSTDFQKFPSRRGWVVLVIILGLGALVCYGLIVTAPRVEKEETVRRAKIVQTVTLAPGTERVSIEVYGTVIPANEATIQLQVEGPVVRHHAALVPGGIVGRGEEVIAVDDADYRIALTAQEAALEEAKYELEVEKGRVAVALHEWDQLKGELADDIVNQSLVLREPHLRRAEALISSAKNQIAKALLDLQRTSIEAPFNAMVLAESVEVGQLVKIGDAVATLVGTDEFWVQVAVPLERLGLIQFPDDEATGAKALVFWETGEGRVPPREGEVFRLLGDLETQGRMARILVRVDDPLNLQSYSGSKAMTPLLLRAYVRVEIEAGRLENVLRIDRKALREGDRIWVVDRDNKLQVRDAEVRWRRKDHVFINDCLKPGEQLIVSRLRVAVPGMLVNPQPAANDGPTAP